MSAPHAGKVVLELRVHGVRGTPTASMLGVDAARVDQVAGDRLTGFYRIAESADPPLRTLPPGMALEAYSWGELTSGVRGAWGWVTRVLWLALLPFALVNLAFWARTQVGENSGQARWGLRAVRLSGLLLTVVAVLTMCFISVDLIAWQCYRANAIACPVLPGWLDVVASLRAGQRIALFSLPPLAIVALLVALTHQSVGRYEATPDDPDQAERDAHRDRCASSVLEHPKMWQGEQRTRHLLHLHVAAALSTIVLVSGIHLLVRGASGILAVSTLAAVVVMVAVVGRILTIDPEDLEYRDVWRLEVASQHSERRRDEPHWMVRPGEALRRLRLQELARVAAGVVALHLVLLWGVRLPAPTTAAAVAADEMSWYGENVWFIGLFVALTIVHVIVFVGGRASLAVTLAVVMALLGLVALGWVVPTWLLAVLAACAVGAMAVFHRWRSRQEEYRAFAWGGAGASVLLGAATMVALLFTSAAAVGAANYLNGDSQSVADLITVRNERSPLSAQWEKAPLTLAGDVVLEGARVVRHDGGVLVTDGTVRTDALTRRSRVPSERDSSYSLASSMVREATLVLPRDATTVRLVSSCFSTRLTDRDEVCTGESRGFRTAGTLDVRATCPVDGGRVRCLTVAAAHGRVALEVSDPPQTPLVVPQILVWTPLVQSTLLVLGAALVGLLVWRFHRRAAGPICDLVDADPLAVPVGDRASVREARVTAALAHRAERILDGVGALTALLAVTMLALSSGGDPPWALAEWLRPLATLSLYVALALSLGLMLLGARVRRSPSARRNVGVLWDITTFWPRSAHPFAPPCYAERVVPEITARVRWALSRDEDRVVVLSGHSQGSLICVAVASRLNGMAHQLRLLTYGSQIRALYGRVFPGAAGPAALGYVPTQGPALLGDAFPDVPDDDRCPSGPEQQRGLRFALASPHDWVNLFRRSDPLGYRVWSDRDDTQFDRPTLEVRPEGSGDPGSLVMTHGGYQHTPEYREVVARWTGETVHRPPDGPARADALPPI